MINAGTLNSLVTIRSRVAGQDDIGQPVETWSDFASVWADIRRQTGMESIRSGKITSAVVASVRIRPISGIDAGMHLIYGSERFEIKSVLRNREFFDLVCEATS